MLPLPEYINYDQITDKIYNNKNNINNPSVNVIGVLVNLYNFMGN